MNRLLAGLTSLIGPARFARLLPIKPGVSLGFIGRSLHWHGRKNATLDSTLDSIIVAQHTVVELFSPDKGLDHLIFFITLQSLGELSWR